MQKLPNEEDKAMVNGRVTGLVDLLRATDANTRITVIGEPDRLQGVPLNTYGLRVIPRELGYIRGTFYLKSVCYVVEGTNPDIVVVAYDAPVSLDVAFRIRDTIGCAVFVMLPDTDSLDEYVEQVATQNRGIVALEKVKAYASKSDPLFSKQTGIWVISKEENTKEGSK